LMDCLDYMERNGNVFWGSIGGTPDHEPPGHAPRYRVNARYQIAEAEPRPGERIGICWYRLLERIRFSQRVEAFHQDVESGEIVLPDPPPENCGDLPGKSWGRCVNRCGWSWYTGYLKCRLHRPPEHRYLKY
jgi:hypothetical protein